MPPLATAPSDFSRMVVSPPALLPGEGLLFISGAVDLGVALPPVEPRPQLRRDLRTGRGRRAGARRHRSQGSPRGSPWRPAPPGGRRRCPAPGWRSPPTRRPSRRIAGRAPVPPPASRCAWRYWRWPAASQALQALLDRFAGAACVLNGEGLEVRTARQRIILGEASDLDHLAAQAHQQDRAEVRVRRGSPQRAAKHIEAFAFVGHAAATGVGDRHHPIDVWETRTGRCARRRRRSSAPRWPNSSPRSAPPHSCAPRHGRRCGDSRETCVAPRCAAEVGHVRVGALFPTSTQIVHVHMSAGGDRLRGDADHLPVFAHRASRRDRRGGDLSANGTGSRVVTSPGRTVPEGSLRTATTTLSAGCSQNRGFVVREDCV